MKNTKKEIQEQLERIEVIVDLLQRAVDRSVTTADEWPKQQKLYTAKEAYSEYMYKLKEKFYGIPWD